MEMCWIFSRISWTNPWLPLKRSWRKRVITYLRRSASTRAINYLRRAKRNKCAIATLSFSSALQRKPSRSYEAQSKSSGWSAWRLNTTTCAPRWDGRWRVARVTVRCNWREHSLIFGNYAGTLMKGTSGWIRLWRSLNANGVKKLQWEKLVRRPRGVPGCSMALGCFVLRCYPTRQQRALRSKRACAYGASWETSGGWRERWNSWDSCWERRVTSRRHVPARRRAYRWHARLRTHGYWRCV